MVHNVHTPETYHSQLYEPQGPEFHVQYGLDRVSEKLREDPVRHFSYLAPFFEAKLAAARPPGPDLIPPTPPGAREFWDEWPCPEVDPKYQLDWSTMSVKELRKKQRELNAFAKVYLAKLEVKQFREQRADDIQKDGTQPNMETPGLEAEAGTLGDTKAAQSSVVENITPAPALMKGFRHRRATKDRPRSVVNGVQSRSLRSSSGWRRYHLRELPLRRASRVKN